MDLKNSVLKGLQQQTNASKNRSAHVEMVLIDFSLTVKAATLIYIPGRGSAISSATQGKSGAIYNLVKN